MELLNIEFFDNMIRLYLNDETHQEGRVVELEAGLFFDKIASAFYSAKAIKPEADK